VHWEELAGDIVDDAERLPDAHDLVVEVDRAREAVDVREALEDGDAVALAREAARRSCGRRARSRRG
jgi:hypothetical protein